ncbi:hypothetical protein BJX62DRAFT_192882 [Aspergillus germanicus]
MDPTPNRLARVICDRAREILTVMLWVRDQNCHCRPLTLARVGQATLGSPVVPSPDALGTSSDPIQASWQSLVAARGGLSCS